MKRSLLVLSLLAIVCLALAGCCPRVVPTLTVSQIPWPDDEVTSYTIEDQDGNTVGSLELTIEKQNDVYLLIQYIDLTEEETILHYTVDVNAVDLKPISGTQTIQTPDAVVDVVTTYSQGKVSVTVTINGEEQSADLDLPRDAYDNDEVPFLLRAIPFEMGYAASLTIVVPAAGLTPKATVTVVSEEAVDVPAGSFNCYKLELSALGSSQYLWYGVDGPHYLVKYDNGVIIMLLTDISIP